MSDWQKQVVCRYFVLGSCKNGASCAYSHDPDLIPQSTGFQQVAEYVDGYYEDYVGDDALDFSEGYPQEGADYSTGADGSIQHYPSEVYPVPGEYAPLGEEMLSGVDEDPGGGGNNELELEVPHNTCFDSCQIQGLSVGVNTMSLDACSDPNCLDNSQTLVEAQDFTPGAVYPTSPTYIVYTPVYQSPALSPAAGSLPPLMSPPPPLYPQPISIVTTSPGGVGGGLKNVVLSPGRSGRAEIMSPGRAEIMSPGRSEIMSPGRAEIMSPGRTDILSPGSTEIMSPGFILSPKGLGGSMMHEVNRVPNSCLSPTDTSLNPQDTSISPIDTSLSPQDNRLNPPDTSHSPSFETNLNPSVSGTLTCITSPQQSVINKVSPAIKSKLNPETAEWSPTKNEIFIKSALAATDKAASSATTKAAASSATATTAASSATAQTAASSATAKTAASSATDEGAACSTSAVGKAKTKSATSIKATTATPSSLSNNQQNETGFTAESISHSTESQENANSLQSSTDLPDSWKVPRNWAEAPVFVPKPLAKQESSLRSSGSGVSSAHQQKRSSTLQQMPSSVPSRNASDTNQQPRDDQQPKQRSWAQVVNSNIVKQQSVNLTVREAESQLCPYFRVGECRYGDICMYIHGIMCDYCGQNILHPQHENQRKAHLGECLQEHERDMELSFAVARSKEKTCGICMETVLDKPKGEARFGILPSCNHCFCLPCIRKWRQAKQFEHKIIRACPECRQTSDFICPSRFWVETTEQKEQLLSEYKKNLGLKECKYFNKGSGECPFGNKCFYQHADKDGRVVDVGPPRKPQRRVNADGNLSLVQRLLLYDFLEEREGQLVLPLDFVELFDLYSDSEDWSENEP